MFFDLKPPRAVWNLGHRGAREVAPENTLAAFRAALDAGADGIECDVMLSRDRQVVVIHDATLDRTTNGHGRVADHTLTELRQLDAGSWFNPRFAGEKIPTLAETLAWVKASGAVINIEVKRLTEGPSSDGIEPAVLDVVRASGVNPDKILFSSFNPFTVMRLRQMAPDFARGLLFAPDLPLVLRRAWLAFLGRPHALHPHYRQVTPDFVRRTHARGRRIAVWTVNDEPLMHQLISLGVEVIITDRPDRLTAVLQGQAG